MRASFILILGLPVLALTSCDKANQALSKVLGSKKKTIVTAPKPVASNVALKPREFPAFAAASKQRVVVVHFKAPEDAPNPQLTQQLDALAKNLPFQIAIGTLDVSQARELAAKEGVTATPEVRVYREGACVERVVSAQANQLEAIVAAQVAQLKPNLAAELASKKSAIAPALDADGNPVAPKEAPVQVMQKDWKPAGFERAMVPKAEPTSKDKAELGKIVNNAKGTVESLAATGNNSAAASAVRQIAAADFETFKGTGNQRLVIVDFYADWCPPCRKIGPVLESIAQAGKGRILLGKLNVDAPEAKALCAKLGVSGIPDVRFYRDGKEVDRVVGFPGDAALTKKIDAQLAKLDKPKEAKEGATPAPAQPAVAPIAPMQKGWVPAGMEKGR